MLNHTPGIPLELMDLSSMFNKMPLLNVIDPNPSGDLSDELAHYISMINIVGICTILSVFGIITNIINMVVFTRQGFHETVNITLFATAVSSLIMLVTTLWVAVCSNPLMLSARLPFIPSEVQMLTGDIPHVMAVNATSWLTAYVTFERCLCIAFPLKVKDILTPKKTKAIIMSIFVLVIVSQIPTYLSYHLKWKFDPQTNQSLVGLEIQEEYVMLVSFVMYITTIFGPFLSFIIVVVCTIVLVVKLRQKSKWRTQTLSNRGKEDLSVSRDRKVIKMVLAMAVIFILSYIPSVIITIWLAAEPEMSPVGTLVNNFFVSISFAFVFETLNASINIFVYYNMSSKYKTIFRSIFLRKQSRPSLTAA